MFVHASRATTSYTNTLPVQKYNIQDVPEPSCVEMWCCSGCRVVQELNEINAHATSGDAKY